MAEENTDTLITPGDEELDSLGNVNHSAASPFSANNVHDNHARQLRSSLGSSLDEDGSISNSAQKQESSSKTQRRIPNYLRASTGSCHDLCKYGRRNASEEEKPWKTPRRKTAKSSQNKLNSVEVTVSDLKKKEKSVKHEDSADTKERFSLDGNGTISYSPEVQSCHNISSDGPKLKTSLDTKPYSIGKGKNLSSVKEAHHLRKNNSSPREKSPPLNPPEIIKKKITAEKTYDKNIKLSSSSVESKRSNVGSSSVADNSDGTITIKGGRNRDAKTGRAVTASRNTGTKALSAPLSRKVGKVKGKNKADTKDDEVSERTLHVVKTGAGNAMSESITDKNDIAPLQSSSSNVEPSSLLANEEDEGMMHTLSESDGAVSNDDVPVEVVQPMDEKQNKKTLRKTRKMVVSGDKYSSSGKSKFTSGKAIDPKNLQSRSASTIDNKADKYVKSMNAGKEHPIKEKQNVTLKKSRLVISEDKHRPPVKLKFRSGKVVNLPQENNNTPRRLKFRRPKPINAEADKSISDKHERAIGNTYNLKEKEDKLLRKNKVVGNEEKLRSPVKIYRSGKTVDPPSDNDIAKRLKFRKVRVPRIEGGKGDSRIRTFRTTSSKDDTNDAEISGKKFTLKHQSVQAKKDAQVSLNNVIEETASKLVESRKSKVKALVGAFETVISLQEGKTSSQTAG